MARTVEEWIGQTDDRRAPPRVRQRIFDDCGGKCHICEVVIVGKKWALDHVKALINGGENRQSNLKPVHIACHKVKTASDVAEKAKVAAIRQKHNGIVADSKPIRSPGFRKSKHAAKREARAKDALPELPRQPFYREVSP